MKEKGVHVYAVGANKAATAVSRCGVGRNYDYIAADDVEHEAI